MNLKENIKTDHIILTYEFMHSACANSVDRATPYNIKDLSDDDPRHKEFGEKISEIYKKHLEYIPELKRKLNLLHSKQILKPSHNFISFSLLMQIAIDEDVSKYLLYFPEDQEMRLEWNTFKYNLAILHYQDEIGLPKEIEKFLNIFKLKIASSCEEKIQINHKKYFYDVYKELMNYPQFMEITPASIIYPKKNSSLTNCKNDPFSIESITNGYQQIINTSIGTLYRSLNILTYKLYQNSQWLIPILEEKTAQIESDIPDLMEELSESSSHGAAEVMIYLKQLRSSIQGMYNYSHICQIKKNIFEKFIEHFSAFSKNIKSFYEKEFFPDLFASRRTQQTSENKELEILTTLHKKTLQNLHILFDTYISRYYVFISSIFTSIKTWYISKSNLENFKDLIQAIKTEPDQSIESIDIDTQIKNLGLEEKVSIPTKHASQNKKRSSASKKKAVNKNTKFLLEQAKVIQTTTIKTLAPITPTVAIKYDLVLDLKTPLRALSEKKFPSSYNLGRVSQIALMQTRFYVEQLASSYHRIQKGQLDIPSVINIYASSYFSLEQSLRFMQSLDHSKIEDLSYHNLKKYIHEIGVKKFEARDLQTIEKLYLACFWVREPFTQIGHRSTLSMGSINTPDVLQTVCDVYLDKKYIEKNKATLKNDLLKVAKDTSYLIKNILGKSSHLTNFSLATQQNLSNEAARITEESVNYLDSNTEAFEFKKKEFAQISNLLNYLEKNIYNDFLLKGRIQQMRIHLHNLEIYLANLGEHISEKIFGTSVLKITEHMHLALQEAIRYVHQLTKGYELPLDEHELDLLLQKIEGSKEDQEFLKENFAKISKYCRYPFESTASKSKLHKICTQALYVYEYPELTEPDDKFEINASNYLNLLPNCKKVSSKDVIQELLPIIGRSLDILLKILKSHKPK